MFSRGLGGYAQALWYTMPTTKRKAPPAPGAANALASALGVAKFTRIKPGELQHEVDVGQAVSESTFSIHAAFDSDLRKSLAPDATSRMVKLNRNHARYFARIKHLITVLYIEKFGKQESGEAAASAASAASAGV